MEALYNCRTCKGPQRIEEVCVDGVILTPVICIDKDGDAILDHNKIEIQEGRADRYQCATCGETVKDTDGQTIQPDEVAEFLSNQTEWNDSLMEDRLDSLEETIKEFVAMREAETAQVISEVYGHAVEATRDVFRSLTARAAERRDEIDEMIRREPDMEKATREAYDLEWERINAIARRQTP
jgi:hypothetical protein